MVDYSSRGRYGARGYGWEQARTPGPQRQQPQRTPGTLTVVCRRTGWEIWGRALDGAELDPTCSLEVASALWKRLTGRKLVYGPAANGGVELQHRGIDPVTGLTVTFTASAREGVAYGLERWVLDQAAEADRASKRVSLDDLARARAGAALAAAQAQVSDPIDEPPM